MSNKLTWEEIKKLDDQEWVELVDYDWPDEFPDPKAGVVRVHAKDRAEFDRLAAIGAPFDAACVFVGDPLPASGIRSYATVVIDSKDA